MEGGGMERTKPVGERERVTYEKSDKFRKQNK